MKKILVIILAVVILLMSTVSAFADSVDCRDSFILDGYDDGRQNLDLSDITLTGDIFTVQYYLIGTLVEKTYQVISVNGNTFYSFYNNDNTLVEAILCFNINSPGQIYGLYNLGVDVHSISPGQVFSFASVSGFGSVTVINSLLSSSGMTSSVNQEIKDQLSIVTTGSKVTGSVKVCTVKDVLFSPYNSFDDLFPRLFTFTTIQLQIWQSTVNFVMDPRNRISLLGLIAWLFMLGIASIRKLLRGV